MSELADSLAEFERTLRRVGARVAAHLGRGLEAATTRRLLDHVGLEPSDEVIEWFSWHNGAGDPSVTLLTCELAPGVYVFDLETLCQEYLDTRRDFDYVAHSLSDRSLGSSALWSPSWFPLARLDAGCVAVDLAGGGTGSSPVHAAWFDSDLDYKAAPQWPTVAAFVDTLSMRYKSGVYGVDPDGKAQGPDVDAGPLLGA